MPSESFRVPNPIIGTALFTSNEVIDPPRTLILLSGPKLKVAERLRKEVYGPVSSDLAHTAFKGMCKRLMFLRREG